ncbi:hypothetical protein CLV58_109135 [Spirosoma oryzae]|uniref:Uncharacterized protein n=1 Tax=Spirosoma oryzae TaxID=1469603 RepID=A0A2T0SYA3_9BACT|nr:hypothetical protein [Spirosoma oryzae]PRY38408.1 hypothetical protein CLV58_109135 [Spirosoma oryzae]
MNQTTEAPEERFKRRAGLLGQDCFDFDRYPELNGYPHKNHKRDVPAELDQQPGEDVNDWNNRYMDYYLERMRIDFPHLAFLFNPELDQ